MKKPFNGMANQLVKGDWCLYSFSEEAVQSITSVWEICGDG